MIPVRLQLKNFMSYGESVPPLEFAGMNLVCLSGDNGNGKSAILDAMTWALFGKTRAKSDEQIIRIGANDCAVILEFRIGEDHYRVDRRISRAKSAKGKTGTDWQLQIRQDDGGFRSLSGATADETEKKIVALLHMNHKTFLSTSYLAQGRADEFTRASRTERKNVLASILDLSRYDKLEDLAKGRQKEAAQREKDAQGDLNRIDAELDREDIYHSALEAAQKNQNLLSARLAQIETERETLQRELTLLEQQEQTRRGWEAQVRDSQTEIARAQKEQSDLQTRIRKAEDFAARRDEIEADVRTLVEMQTRLEQLNVERDALIARQADAHRLEQVIRRSHDELEQERFRVQCDFDNIVQAEKDLGLNEQIEGEIWKNLEGLGDPEGTQDTLRREIETARAHFIEVKTACQSEQNHEKTLNVRLEALQSSDAAECLYCGQNLPLNKRQDAIVETEKLLETIGQSIAQQKKQGQQAKQQIDAAETALRTVEARLREKSGFLAQAETLRQASEQIRRRIVGKSKLQQILQILQNRIQVRDYATTEQAQLAELLPSVTGEEGRIRDAIAHARGEEKRLQPSATQHANLKRALEILQDEPPRLADISQRLAEMQSREAAAGTELALLAGTAQSLGAARQRAANLTGTRQQAEAELRTAEREIGAQQAKLDNCAVLRNERTLRLGERDAATKDAGIYKELTAAFGKKGIQALIIDRATPEIQNEANRLLSQLTTNGTSVKIITAKNAKSSDGIIETLDIDARDNEGERPFEMFSGGEAFRINFALRIALSKLLANRAGAPLQTLIIDEGFGTQDGRGREAIADALREVAQDFALVLVITHADDLKEAFPVRIEVVKDMGGSTFVVQSAN